MERPAQPAAHSQSLLHSPYRNGEEEDDAHLDLTRPGAGKWVYVVGFLSSWSSPSGSVAS